MSSYMPKAESVEWGTPARIFDPLNREFEFTLDVCASAWNAKVLRYYSQEQDGLQQSWKDNVCWCNPPYGASEISRWLSKARTERFCCGAKTVLLLPNTTDTLWFHEYVWDDQKHSVREGIALRFFKGRIKFDLPPGSVSKGFGNVKGSILVIV